MKLIENCIKHFKKEFDKKKLNVYSSEEKEKEKEKKEIKNEEKKDENEN